MRQMRLLTCMACLIPLGELNAQTPVTQKVVIDTSLMSAPGLGPFTIAFALVDGSGVANGNASVKINNLKIDGTGKFSAVSTSGSVAGSVVAGFEMTDQKAVLTTLSLGFTAGRQLSFSVTSSSAIEEGGTPDRLAVSIYSSAGSPIGTMAPLASAYAFGIDLGMSSSSPDLYAGTPLTPAARPTDVTFSISAGTGDPLPALTANGVSPIYNPVPAVQPASWATAFGSNFATAESVWNEDFPTTLNGISMTVEGKPAFLWYAGPKQINFQVPDSATRGAVPVVVTTAAGSTAGSVVLADAAPSLSMLGDAKHIVGVILTPDGSGNYGGGAYDIAGPVGAFAYATRPVRAGETLILYGVGFGSTDPGVPAGKPFRGSAPTVSPVEVTIGGVFAPIIYSGVVGAGLFQINLTVPQTFGGDLEVIAKVGSTATPSGRMLTLQ